MGLADKFEEAIVKSDPWTQWLESLSEDDRAAVEKFAGDPRLSTKKFLAIIRAEGGRIGDDRLNAWRRDLGFPG